ncbi:MAG: type II secretion system protein GspM [Gammaproteobacteria bacterium]|nr:type II secretion system protein GspM [Gammaproteobacteria bacterium]
MNSLLEIWHGLAARDRALTIVITLLCLLATSYGFVLQPLKHSIEAENVRRLSLEASVREIERILPQLPQASLKQEDVMINGSSTPLLALIDSALKETAFHHKTISMQTLNDHSVALVLDNIDFSEMIIWLANIQDAAAVTVTEITLQPGEKNGMVKANINLIQK